MDAVGMVWYGRWRYYVAIAVVIMPAILWWMADADSDRGLIWFFGHQIYYLPLSWLGEPLFRPDREVMFSVEWPGRVVAALVYGGAVLGGARLLDRCKPGECERV